MSQDAGKSANSKGGRLWAIFGSVIAVIVAALLIIAFVPGINAFGVYPAESQIIALSSPPSVSRGSPSGVLVAVFMPNKALSRWSSSPYVKNYLEFKGYTVDLLYAGENDVATQIGQIGTEITKSPKVMVIFPVDGSALDPVLAKAKQAGIPVIAYNKLITGTANVDYFATFDSYNAGVLQGRCIEDKLGLKASSGSFAIELFAGMPDNSNIIRFPIGTGQYFYDSKQVYQGAMSVLQPYIESGKLVVKSHQITFESVAMQSQEGISVQARMDALLKKYYRDTKLDAILSPDDSISAGIIASLKKAGYGAAAKPFPVLTGQGCELANVRAIINEKQSMSVFIDVNLLDHGVAGMVDAIIQGKEVPITDKTSFNNGVKVVPTLLCDPVLVDEENYKQILIESGYYTEGQILPDVKP